MWAISESLLSGSCGSVSRTKQVTYATLDEGGSHDSTGAGKAITAGPMLI